MNLDKNIINNISNDEENILRRFCELYTFQNYYNVRFWKIIFKNI